MKDEIKMLLSVGVGSLILIAVFIFLSQPPKSATNPAEAQAVLIRDDSPKIGPADAKVTIVEFADMQCPACASTHPAVNQILKQYEGKIRYVFRHYPLVQHQNAEIAAIAVEAAGRQNKFWEMQDKLFATQTQWENETDPTLKFTALAKELNLDTAKLTADLKDTSIKDKLNRDVADGNTVGVMGTPTFYINGVAYDQPITVDNLKTQIDNLLK